MQVIYVEACESGSIFQGLLSDSLNIYATTASNAQESSWGTYCPGMVPSPPEEFNTCLGDLYSVAFLENRCGLIILATARAACPLQRCLRMACFEWQGWVCWTWSVGAVICGADCQDAKPHDFCSRCGCPQG